MNISSIFGITGMAGQAAYCTSKFAVRGFTESLRMELFAEAPHITVTCEGIHALWNMTFVIKH